MIPFCFMRNLTMLIWVSNDAAEKSAVAHRGEGPEILTFASSLVNARSISIETAGLSR